MLKRIIIFLVLAAIASTLLHFALESTYDVHQFASQEAQESLEVTETQTAELKASAVVSDTIAYALIGAIFSALAGAVCAPYSTVNKRLIGGLVGLGLGAAAGVASANIGHWFDGAIPFPRDPMLYWFGRLGLMLLPIAIASGLAVAVSGDFKKHVTESLVGSLLGGLAATVIYCLVSGAATPIEGHERIFPGFASNRALLIGLLTLVGLGAATLLGRQHAQQSAAASDSASEPN